MFQSFSRHFRWFYRVFTGTLGGFIGIGIMGISGGCRDVSKRIRAFKSISGDVRGVSGGFTSFRVNFKGFQRVAKRFQESAPARGFQEFSETF